jgi:hypothetical protein
MTIRTSSKTVTFRQPFLLKGVDRMLPAADYRVATDEELIEGVSFPAYRRIATMIFVPAPTGSAVEMVAVDSLDLEAALERDAATQNAPPQDCSRLLGPKLQILLMVVERDSESVTGPFSSRRCGQASRADRSTRLA